MLHAWCPEFFQFFVSPVDIYTCSDEETHKHVKFNVARILVRTKHNLVFNQTINIGVNGETYSINMEEDSQGSLRIVMPPISGLKQGQRCLSSSSNGVGSNGECNNVASPRPLEKWMVTKRTRKR